MTRALAGFDPVAPVGLPRSVSRVWAAILSPVARLRDGSGPLRPWVERRLVQATILTCAILAVARRTNAHARAVQKWRSVSRSARRAWAEAEGFEMEAAAGIALVVLAFVIVLHGLLTG